MSLTEKLVFLCKNGKREMIGAYLRNQTILHRREVKDAMKRRERANVSNAHLKKTVKFGCGALQEKQNCALCR